jgi:hypothetical protein
VLLLILSVTAAGKNLFLSSQMYIQHYQNCLYLFTTALYLHDHNINILLPKHTLHTPLHTQLATLFNTPHIMGSLSKFYTNISLSHGVLHLLTPNIKQEMNTLESKNACVKCREKYESLTPATTCQNEPIEHSRTSSSIDT